jgi:hypothetical protein
LAQLADLGATLLNGPGLELKRLSLGLHLGKARHQRGKVDARRPGDDPILPVAGAFAIYPGIADYEARSLELTFRGVNRARCQPKRSGETASLRPHGANAASEVVTVHGLEHIVPDKRHRRRRQAEARTRHLLEQAQKIEPRHTLWQSAMGKGGAHGSPP